jgi:hypothetical protein
VGAGAEGDRAIPLTCRLDLGSLAVHLSAERGVYPEVVAELFATAPRPLAAVPDRPDAEVVVHETPGRPVPVPDDGMVFAGTPAAPEIHTEVVSLQLLRHETPVRIVVAVRSPGVSERVLKVHLSVVLFKALALLDRLVLHAAAVEFRGSASAFLGPKGAGKSTTCLALARAGATVLADDRVVLRRTGDGFVVSGCGERSRITARTERHFFAEPLPEAARDVEGVLKKEFPGGRLFSWRPHRDHPLHRLFFVRVGRGFQVVPLSRREALVHLLRETRGWHRFSGGEDHRRHLGFLHACVDALPAVRLELSEDLDELAKLVDVLAGAGAPA